MTDENVEGNSTEKVDSSDFFSQLESEVNGMQTEGEEHTNTEVTHGTSGSEQVTHNESNGSNGVDWDNENNPYKKGIRIQVVRRLK